MDRRARAVSRKKHYLSWKEFKKNYLLIKYEDLLLNPYKEFHRLSEYLAKLLNVKFENDKIENYYHHSHKLGIVPKIYMIWEQIFT